MRFENAKKQWIDFTPEFPSNHFGKYKNCGEWAIPVFPNNMSLVGSIPTPYIFDDRCDFRDVANAIKEVYDLSPEERMRRGEKGREWASSDESMMSARKMCENVIECVDKTIASWVPRPAYEFIKVQKYPKKKIVHKLVY
jgi:hypothetical protein